MSFFLYEILARLVAISLFVYFGRKLWRGLVERKIDVVPGDWLESLMFRTSVAHRDSRPVLYWMTVVFEILGLAACVFVAIFGWFHPNS